MPAPCTCMIELRNKGSKTYPAPLTVALVLCPLHEAAPDLYEVLEALMLGEEPWKALTEKAEAALAKARGEQPNQ